MKLSIILMVAGLLIPINFVNRVTADDMLTHQMKKTFCQMIHRTRIYKTEELDVYCVGKVDLS